MCFRKTLIVFFAMSAANSIMAAEWSVNSVLNVQAVHNDNVHTVVTDEVDVTGGSFSPVIDLTYEEPAETFKSEVDLSLTRYRNHPELKRDEGSLGLEWSKQYERSIVQMEGKFSSYSSLDQNLDFSGLTDQQVDRKSRFIKPAWTYKLSENTGVLVSMSYSDISYDEPGFQGFEFIKEINFADYQQLVSSLTYFNDVTEKTQFSLTLNHIDYDGEGNGFQYIGIGPFGIGVIADEVLTDYKYDVVQLGYVYKIADTSKINIDLGVNHVDVNQSRISHLFDINTGLDYGAQPAVLSETSTRGNVYGLGYEYEQERATYKINFSKKKDTDSTGGIVDVDSISMNYMKHINERLSLSFMLAWENRRFDDTTNVTADTEREKISFSPKINWKIDRNISLNAYYRYLEITRNSNTESGESNAFYLGLNWYFDKLASTY